jgi:hypothetical protein
VYDYLEVLDSLNPDNTFDPLSLMQEQRPERDTPDSEVFITCTDDYLFFKKDWNTNREKTIAYSLKSNVFREIASPGYLVGVWKISEHIYALESSGGTKKTSIMLLDIRDGNLLTTDGGELLEDGSNWFILGSPIIDVIGNKES